MDDISPDLHGRCSVDVIPMQKGDLVQVWLRVEPSAQPTDHEREGSANGADKVLALIRCAHQYALAVSFAIGNT